MQLNILISAIKRTVVFLDTPVLMIKWKTCITICKLLNLVWAAVHGMRHRKFDHGKLERDEAVALVRKYDRTTYRVFRSNY